jgi:hypothetical protein
LALEAAVADVAAAALALAELVVDAVAVAAVLLAAWACSLQHRILYAVLKEERHVPAADAEAMAEAGGGGVRVGAVVLKKRKAHRPLGRAWRRRRARRPDRPWSSSGRRTWP